MPKENVIGKLVITGELVLDEPLLIGDGGQSTEAETDIHVLCAKDNVPYIPGTSLAGVLRAFLREESPQVAALLFGTAIDEEEFVHNSSPIDLQSTLSISDVKLDEAVITLRDGVSIDSVTGVAIKHHKFDFEAVDSGANGIIYMEATLRQIHADYAEVVDKGLDLLQERLLSGFYVGARTTMGFGRVHVKKLKIDRYDFREPKDVLAWLTVDKDNGHKPALMHKTCKGVSKSAYAANDFVVDASFALYSSLIIRDYDADEEGAAVMRQDSRERYIIPGSSLKGVMRHRAEYILGRLGKKAELLEKLMGPSVEAMKNAPNENKWKSRFLIDEAAFRRDDVALGKQSRNRIDRFTGGTVDTALFSTKPIWQKNAHEAVIKLHFGVVRAESWEAGLTLLLLKDLWTGRTAIGGEKGIGRGVLSGIEATISYQGRKWQLSAKEKTDAETVAALQEFVDALIDKE